MDTSIAASWLFKGHFDFSAQDPHHTTTQLIRDELCALLGLPKDYLRIAFYPTGMTKKHTFWWRETDLDYAEAQWFAEISKSYPVLSLGVSVEKGLEGAGSHLAARPEQLMDRRTWDWPRLVEHISNVLSIDVVAAARTLQRPINVRIRSRRRSELEPTAWETRSFSFVAGGWFERHAGRADPETICEYVRQLDLQSEVWAIVHFACDLGPAEAGGLSTSKAAAILVGFDGVRRRFRSASTARPGAV